MADKNYKLSFELSDGSIKTVQFTAPQGPAGADGSNGLAVYTFNPDTGAYIDGYYNSSSVTIPEGFYLSTGDLLIANNGRVYRATEVTELTFYPVFLFSIRGDTGPAGTTPVKGEDYFTDEDKTEIINAVLANFVDVSEVGM